MSRERLRQRQRRNIGRKSRRSIPQRIIAIERVTSALEAEGRDREAARFRARGRGRLALLLAALWGLP